MFSVQCSMLDVHLLLKPAKNKSNFKPIDPLKCSARRTYHVWSFCRIPRQRGIAGSVSH